MQSGSQSNVTQAAVLVLACMAILGLVDNFVKLIAEDAGLWQFHLTRSVLVCALMIVLGRVLGWRLRPRRWGAVLIRSGLAAVSMAIYFGGIAVMPIAQVGAGLFTAPIFVLLFSSLLFRTPVGVWRLAAALIGFCGVLLVLRPDANGLGVMTLLPIGAGVTWSLTALTTRHLCSEETTATLIFGFFAVLGVFGVIGLLVLGVLGEPLGWGAEARFFTTGWATPTPRFLFWVVVQGVASMVALACLTRAYQIAETSYVAVFEYSFLGFAGFWSWILWSEALDALALAGIAAIVLSGAVIALRTRET